ncbi:cytochrome c biogenesis protein ResB [bacterium]|nr:cytochrome c biogenesis protein ResB [bacterium]
MGKEDKTDIFDSLWKFLASVKLAIFTLIALASSSIVGTIVEQQAEPATNIALLAKLFGDETAPSVYNIFAAMGFMDMYHSWWFSGLLGIFCINLIVCSIDRLPKTWRFIKKPLRPMAEKVLKTLPIRKEIQLDTTLNKAKDEFANILGDLRYRVHEASEDDSIQLYTQKGKYGRIGVYVVHLCIILIFLGAIIGIRFGFKGYVSLPEGSMSSYAYTNGDEKIPLGFEIKCNWYETSYYPDSDTPKEFQSELVIYENGKEILTKVIEVNDPLQYKGITFYQSSYGMVPNAVGQFVLSVTPEGGREELLNLNFGDSFEIPGTDIQVTITDYSPALARDRYSGKLQTYSENMANPAVALKFAQGDKSYTGWVLKRIPETGMLPGGHVIKFIDYWGVEYTGLQVAKDPGVWLIYLASIVMTAGLYICFFLSHKKIWINISGSKGNVTILLGGTTNRNSIGFEKEIEKIFTRATEAIKGRSNT